MNRRKNTGGPKSSGRTKRGREEVRDPLEIPPASSLRPTFSPLASLSLFLHFLVRTKDLQPTLVEYLTIYMSYAGRNAWD